MNDKKWAEFFTLLDDVTNMEAATWQEKRAEVVAKAKEHDSDTALEEFLDWFDGEVE